MLALTGIERSYASAIGQTMHNLTVQAEVGSVMEGMLGDLEAWEWANKEEVLKKELEHARAQVQALKVSERALLEVRWWWGGHSTAVLGRWCCRKNGWYCCGGSRNTPDNSDLPQGSVNVKKGAPSCTALLAAAVSAPLGKPVYLVNRRISVCQASAAAELQRAAQLLLSSKAKEAVGWKSWHSQLVVKRSTEAGTTTGTDRHHVCTHP